ncbi:hypothetical protein DE146DRAFT_646764 [Phaeosphaeria sp. MPI-PUGE-AT-0046c]|nr:hypothetical protein DE146DRAFT_646764 [Phaeosphaeria sp. MPI-PUGE-AT-0046c]
MTERAIITFAQTGVQPPVYVVTSLSDPPWETLEMDVDKEQTASANLIFTKRFDNIPEGSYQYKIRVGDGLWVVDESKDSAADEHGNRNNVLHVNKVTKEQLSRQQQDLSLSLKDSRKDSTIDASDIAELPRISVPTVVVDKVANKSQADRDDDVPSTCVEKIDRKPAYGDDFGEHATTTQKVAHDMRARDASPNRLVVTSRGHVEPGTEAERAAPLFRHESFQEDKAPGTAALDTIAEASASEQNSSEDVANTSSGSNETSNSEEPQIAPLFSHEDGSDDDGADELDMAPLLPHEKGLSGHVAWSDEEVDELDFAPLLPHETGFSQYKKSEITTESDYFEDDSSEPCHYMYKDEDEDYRAERLDPDAAPTYSHDDAQDEDHHIDNYGEDDTPLLPHERDFAVTSGSSPDNGAFSSDGVAQDFFKRGGRASVFWNRTNSSTLPHKLPLTDAEDENLSDPYLERFPVNKAQILERVVSIGLQLPEDETKEEHMDSPVMSEFSQACSSVDLAPVKSHTSLASVPEADDSDEEEDEDMESPPSPMAIDFSSAVHSAPDSQAALMSNNSKRLGIKKSPSNPGADAHAKQSSESDSVAKIDGVKESAMSKVEEVVVTPVQLITPPPELENKHAERKDQDDLAISDFQLRQRQVPKDDSAEGSQPLTFEHVDRAITSSSPIPSATDNETFLQIFVRVVFGSVGRFLTACVGDRKRAGVAIVVGLAAAAYYAFGSA